MIKEFVAWAEQVDWVAELSDEVLEVPEPVRFFMQYYEEIG